MSPAGVRHGPEPGHERDRHASRWAGRRPRGERGPYLAHTGATTVLGAGLSSAGTIVGRRARSRSRQARRSTRRLVVAASLSGAGAFNFGNRHRRQRQHDDRVHRPIPAAPASTRSGRAPQTLAAPHGSRRPRRSSRPARVRFGDGVTAPATHRRTDRHHNGALEFNATTGTMLAGGVSGSGTPHGGWAASWRAEARPSRIRARRPSTRAASSRGTFQGFAPLTIAAGGQVDASGSTAGSRPSREPGLLNVNGVLRCPRRHHQPESRRSAEASGRHRSAVASSAPGPSRFRARARTPAASTSSWRTLIVTGTMSGPVHGVYGRDARRDGHDQRARHDQRRRHARPGPEPGHHQHGKPRASAAPRAIEILGPALGTQYDNIERHRHGDDRRRHARRSPAPTCRCSGDVFTIVSNDGADAVTGTFAGSARGRDGGLQRRERCGCRTSAARATTSRSPRSLPVTRPRGTARAPTTTGARAPTGSAAPSPRTATPRSSPSRRLGALRPGGRRALDRQPHRHHGHHGLRDDGQRDHLRRRRAAAQRLGGSAQPREPASRSRRRSR